MRRAEIEKVEKMRGRNVYVSDEERISMRLSVYTFQDEDVYVSCAPALDLYGCGKTTELAKESFSIVLEEFLYSTSKKGTLRSVLQGLGWQATKKDGWETPSIKELSKKEEVRRVLEKSPVQSTKDIFIPAVA